MKRAVAADHHAAVALAAAGVHADMLHRQQRVRLVAVAGQRFDERVGEKARAALGLIDDEHRLGRGGAGGGQGW